MGPPGVRLRNKRAGSYRLVPAPQDRTAVSPARTLSRPFGRRAGRSAHLPQFSGTACRWICKSREGDPGDMMPFSRRTASDATNRRRVPLSRRFTYRYAFALSLVGVMAFAAFLSVTKSLERIDAKSRQLEQASSQSARIYRITSLAEDLNQEANSFDRPLLASGDPDSDPAKAKFVGDKNRIDERATQLSQEIFLLRQTESGLIGGDPALGFPGVEPAGR